MRFGSRMTSFAAGLAVGLAAGLLFSLTLPAPAQSPTRVFKGRTATLLEHIASKVDRIAEATAKIERHLRARANKNQRP